jgi:hypothetical protein
MTKFNAINMLPTTFVILRNHEGRVSKDARRWMQRSSERRPHTAASFTAPAISRTTWATKRSYSPSAIVTGSTVESGRPDTPSGP